MFYSLIFLLEINFNIYYVNSLWDSKDILELFIDLKYSYESNKLYSSMFNLTVSKKIQGIHEYHPNYFILYFSTCTFILYVKYCWK